MSTGGPRIGSDAPPSDRLAAPQWVAAADFGPRLAGVLLDQAAHLLHLTWVPDLPGAPRGAGEEGHLLAVYGGPGGPGCLASPARGASRPTACGVVAALLQERRLEAAGVAWAEPAPARDVVGRGVFTFPLGPVRGSVTESAGWRFAVMGDEPLALDLRFGYKVRHVEERLGTAGPAGGAAVAERVTGTSPVAHASALAMAWEAALGLEVPDAARYWRGIMAELERLQSHLGDLGALVDSTGLPAGAAELLVWREEVLRLCAVLSGHRYQRGLVTVGGLRAEPKPADDLLPRLFRIADRVPRVIAALDRTPSFLDRLHGTGILSEEVAGLLSPVGPVGRACGRPYDARHDHPYGLYAERGSPERVVSAGGDAWGRYDVRVGEVRASLAWLARRLAEGWPDGPLAAAVPAPPSAGAEIWLGRVEAPRGELVYLVWPGRPGGVPWVRVRTASQVNWAAVPPAVSAGGVLQDVPIIEASFGLSVAAFDR